MVTNCSASCVQTISPMRPVNLDKELDNPHEMHDHSHFPCLGKPLSLYSMLDHDYVNLLACHSELLVLDSILRVSHERIGSHKTSSQLEVERVNEGKEEEVTVPVTAYASTSY